MRQSFSKEKYIITKGKPIRKIAFYSLFLIAILNCAATFATSGNQESESTTEEAHEFYSKFVEYENTNEGVKVTIVKSDKYGDFQDEYVSVDVKVENLNRYSDLEFNIEAIDHEEFKIHNKNKRYTILAGSNEDISFDYSFNKPTSKYDSKKKNVKYKKDIAFARESGRATSSYVSERYIREREKTEREKVELKKREQQETKRIIMILAIVFIVVFIVLIAIYFIRRYIRTHEDFYNILLIIGLSLVISICTIINKTYAYNQQAFMSNTTYSHTYTCEVWHGGIAYTFRYRVSYKYVGEIPTYPENQDSDGDGLVDNYEIYFITDLNSIDTDNDGISDYDEIYIIDTDPLKADTDKNGKSDGEEDYDKDGLTNIEERDLRTYMDSTDTDSDGLSDYEEIKAYHTDPLKEDTDNDGVSDYEEVMVAKKLGISDISSINKNNTMSQELPRDNFDPSLYKENIIQMKVSGDVYGLIENHIEVKERSNATLDNVNSILGKVAFIDNDYETSNLNVTFDISNYSLKKEALKVCTYENGKVKMLDTTLTENNITANINNGYVFVLDIDRYVDNILAYKKDNYK